MWAKYFLKFLYLSHFCLQHSEEILWVKLAHYSNWICFQVLGILSCVSRREDGASQDPGAQEAPWVNINSKGLLGGEDQQSSLLQWWQLHKLPTTMQPNQCQCCLCKEHQKSQWFTKLDLGGSPCCGLIWYTRQGEVLLCVRVIVALKG